MQSETLPALVNLTVSCKRFVPLNMFFRYPVIPFRKKLHNARLSYPIIYPVQHTWNRDEESWSEIKRETNERFSTQGCTAESRWLSGYQLRLPPLRPGFNHDKVVCGLSFSRSQSDSEGFSPGTPVFLPLSKSTLSQLHPAVSGYSRQGYPLVSFPFLVLND